MSERTLVTGASGFIGANLVRRLLGKGHEVHAFVCDKENMWRLKDVSDKVQTHVVDLTNAGRVDEAVRAIQPQNVYHLATYGGYPRETDMTKTFLTNVVGSLNLFTALEQVGSVRHVVSSGTSSEYGLKSEPMRENDILAPNTPYGVAKAAQTHLAQYFSKQRNFPITTLRLLSVYGPFEAKGRLVGDIMRALVLSTSVKLSSPNPKRDFIFVDDVTDAMLAIGARADLGGHVFNIGSGQERSVGEVVESAMNTLNIHVPVEWGAIVNTRTFETTRWVADISKAKELFAWEPRRSLEEGIKKTFAWYKDYGDTA